MLRNPLEGFKLQLNYFGFISVTKLSVLRRRVYTQYIILAERSEITRRLPKEVFLIHRKLTILFLPDYGHIITRLD